MALIERAAYRVCQFARGLVASLTPMGDRDWAEVRSILPQRAWPLVRGMPRADRRHGLRVMRALRAAGSEHPALLQAALLHDAAKAGGGITLFHRAAIVCLKALWPGLLVAWSRPPAPARTALRFPFWAHAHHAARGAAWAAEAGCDPLAVALIRRHQEHPLRATDDPHADRLLAALQAADDRN